MDSLRGIADEMEKKSLVDRNSERGQSFVEFAISLVFILMLLSVVLDLGAAFYTVIVMRDAAQEAAAYGAICPYSPVTENTRDTTVSDGNPQDAHIKERLIASAPVPLKIKMEDIDVYFVDPGVGTSHEKVDLEAVDNGTNEPEIGGSVVVSVELQHEILAPLIGPILGSSTYPLRVAVADTVLRSSWLSQCGDD